MMRNTQNGHDAICNQCRPRSACIYIQAGQGLHCPLTESMDTVVYVDEQRMLRSGCIDAHADLDCHCSQKHKGSFPHIAHHIRKMVVVGRWPLLRGHCSWRFHCIEQFQFQYAIYCFNKHCIVCGKLQFCWRSCE